MGVYNVPYTRLYANGKGETRNGETVCVDYEHFTCLLLGKASVEGGTASRHHNHYVAGQPVS